jgi:hypothetical protein
MVIGATKEAVVANPLADRYAEMLLERISRDNYPSFLQMDMLEAIAPPEVLVQYILHLMDRIADEQYPSVDIMKRIQRLVAEFG